MTHISTELATIPALFQAAVAAGGDRPALGAVEGGRVVWRSWNELAADVDGLRRQLVERDVRPGDRVVQVSANCADWVTADLAIQAAGAVHVPVHPSLANAQIREQIAHSGARVVLVRDRALAERLRGQPVGEGRAEGGLVVEVAAELREERQSGGSADPSADLRVTGAAAAGPDDLATILYTSGTTGAPRGVMLTQRNLAVNAMATTDEIRPDDDDLRLGILPLSHIYARTCDLYSWIYHGGRFVLAESRETVFRDLGLVRPTVINAVPYFYQKAVDELRKRGGAEDETALRELFGGRIKLCLCGGAALAPEVDQFFAERGLPILCGYGLTEASPVISVTTADTYVAGTVGRPLANLEIRLADDGEVQVRGESIMRGYWRDEASTAAILEDGWLKTGDLGAFDADGSLRIVGRKKEILVLATGKNVAPTQVETLLAGSPLVEQACVLGDGRKFLAALVVPNGDALRKEIRQRRLWVWSKRRAVTHPKVRALYRTEIDRCLTQIGHCEQIGQFVILPRAFSQDLGELTAKLSLRREVIAKNFAREIEAMYGAG
jgi:long-chain acyl-CoA synthetase